MTAEEYLRTTYHPDMEYVDGELIDRGVGEYKHGRLQALIAGSFPSTRRCRGLIAPRLKVLASEHRYRIPDVCVMALPYHSEPVLSTPPHLVIEIISPVDETADMLATAKPSFCVAFSTSSAFHPARLQVSVSSATLLRSISDHPAPSKSAAALFKAKDTQAVCN